MSRWDELRSVSESVSRETFEALGHYEALFLKWNSSINLAAKSTLDNFWQRHILDSAQLMRLAPTASQWLDLGSGGGLPGIVLGILMRDYPDRAITLVESNSKKVAFLRTAARETAARATIVQSRIENYTPPNPPNVVTARALAPLSTLLEMSASFLDAGATALFHKGRDYQAEIEEAGDLPHLDLIVHQSMVNPSSVILEIRRRV